MNLEFKVKDRRTGIKYTAILIGRDHPTDKKKLLDLGLNNLGDRCAPACFDARCDHVHVAFEGKEHLTLRAGELITLEYDKDGRLKVRDVLPFVAANDLFNPHFLDSGDYSLFHPSRALFKKAEKEESFISKITEAAEKVIDLSGQTTLWSQRRLVRDLSKLIMKGCGSDVCGSKDLCNERWGWIPIPYSKDLSNVTWRRETIQEISLTFDAAGNGWGLANQRDLNKRFTSMAKSSDSYYDLQNTLGIGLKPQSCGFKCYAGFLHHWLGLQAFSDRAFFDNKNIFGDLHDLVQSLPSELHKFWKFQVYKIDEPQFKKQYLMITKR